MLHFLNKISKKGAEIRLQRSILTDRSYRLVSKHTGTRRPTQVTSFKLSFLHIQICSFLPKLLREVQELETAAGWRLADMEESAFAFYSMRVPSAVPETEPQTKRRDQREALRSRLHHQAWADITYSINRPSV